MSVNSPSYNTALSYKGDATSDAERPPPRRVSAALNENSHITLSIVEWKKGLNIGYSFVSCDLRIFH